jgi:hypothetical protein
MVFVVKVKVYTTFISIFLVEGRWAGLQANVELGQARGDKPQKTIVKKNELVAFGAQMKSFKFSLLRAYY